MEHSYLGNDYCDDILKLLSNEWKGDRVLHVGDYAQPDDETTTQNKEAASHYTSGEGSKPGLHSESQTTGRERAVQFSTALKPRS